MPFLLASSTPPRAPPPLQALNKLSHPNIVHLFATFQDYGTLYYQMELMAGERAEI
jgi:serine/threonine protein kinase